MKLPDKISWGDKYGAAMKIVCPAKAKEYLEACIEHNMRLTPGRTREQAEDIERSNIGYWTGYYDAETAQQVFKAFGVTHPVFGDKRPSVEEAFQAGARAAAGGE